MKWLHFIVSHSLFIAFCAVSLCFQTAVLLQINLSGWFYSFVFFSTICSYNFYWLLSGYSFAAENFWQHIQKHFSNAAVLLLALAGVIICLLHIPGILAEVIAASGLTFLYAVPLLPFKWLHFTRRAGLLKTILLAFTWCFITVYLPYAYSGIKDSGTLLFLGAIRFLFMLMLCIIFDSRDTDVDKIRGLQSLTTLLNPAAVKLLMMGLLIIYLAAGIAYRIYFNQPKQVAALFVTAFAVGIAWYYSFKRQGYYFYYFLIDGLMLFSAIAAFIASI
jgi:4-hydroxybenzoate polyprenyltransferase